MLEKLVQRAQEESLTRMRKHLREKERLVFQLQFGRQLQVPKSGNTALSKDQASNESAESAYNFNALAVKPSSEKYLNALKNPNGHFFRQKIISNQVNTGTSSSLNRTF